MAKVFSFNLYFVFKISENYEDDCLLGYCSVWSCRNLPMFQTCLLPPSSEWSIIMLMMEAVSISETSVNLYQTTWYNIQEDSHLHTHCCENLKSHLKITKIFAGSPVYIKKRDARVFFPDMIIYNAIVIKNINKAWVWTDSSPKLMLT
jgi:hypothetical protein